MELASLASATSQRLQHVWDQLGVEEAERSHYLQQLAVDVANIYNGRVAHQEQRKAAIEGEIQHLQQMIANVLQTMEEQPVVPSCGGLSLLAYRDSLESTRQSLQETWDIRHAELLGMHATLQQLYVDVGLEQEAEFCGVGDKMSISRITAYESEIGRIAAIKTERTATITALCEHINDLWAELDVKPADEYDQIIRAPTRGAGLGWHLGVIDMLNSKLQSLQSEKSLREERITVIGMQITALWKRLGTPESEQTTFLESHGGIDDHTIRVVEEYLRSKQCEFASKLVDLIGGTRSVISAQWREMRTGEAQQQESFPAFFVGADGYSDELYTLHEEYIATLQAQVEDVKPLVKAVEKREELLREKAEYEVIISDPQRLTKGSSAARLREEKLERRVKKELPAVTKRLRQQCVEWEAAHGGKAFTIDGRRYVDVMDGEEAADAQAAAQARQARHAGADASSSSSASFGATSSAATTSAPRSNSNDKGRPALYRPSIIQATASSSAAAAGAGVGPAAAKPRLPGLKKPSSAASTVGHDDDSSSVVPSENAHVAPPRSAAAPTVPFGSTMANRAAARAGEATKAAPPAKPVEASVSGEAAAAAALMLQAL